MTKVYSDMRRLLRQKHCTAKSERGANIAHHSSSFMPGNSRCTYCFSSVFFRFLFCFSRKVFIFSNNIFRFIFRLSRYLASQLHLLLPHTQLKKRFYYATNSATQVQVQDSSSTCASARKTINENCYKHHLAIHLSESWKTAAYTISVALRRNSCFKI